MKTINVFCLYTVFFLFSCENSTSISLSDEYWEGQKILILAQLNLNSNAEVTIQNTFNPVIHPLPKPQIISDMAVFILKDGLNFDTLVFDQAKNKYIGKRIINGGHNYQVSIPQEKDTIKCQILFFPERQIQIEKIKTTIIGDSIKNELKIKFQNFTTGNANVNLSYPSTVLRNSKLESLTKRYNSHCINNSKVDLKCLQDTVYSRTDLLQYFPDRYTIMKTDSIIVKVEYISPELELIINGNSNSTIEFTANNPFKSSFNNAYGYFGYKITITESKSLID